MSINKKIIGLILFSFLFVSIVFSWNSINNLKKSQTANLRLFKEEFLELGRESFEHNSNLFFSNLNAEIHSTPEAPADRQMVLEAIKKIDPAGDNIVVFDLATKQFLPGYNNSNILAVFDETTMDGLMNKYVQENVLNQKKQFDLDNFTEFSVSKSNNIVPKKIHFSALNDQGLMVGYGQDFLTVKIRIEFITRQNESDFQNQLYSSLVIFSLVFLATLLVVLIALRMIFLRPLADIVIAVKEITSGDLTKKIKVRSKDELGQLGLAFNEMTTKLKDSYEVLETKIASRTKELEEERGSLEKKVEERTSELEGLKSGLEKTVSERTATLNSKVLELEKMNDLMVGREIKMAELKKELKELKEKKK